MYSHNNLINADNNNVVTYHEHNKHPHLHLIKCFGMYSQMHIQGRSYVVQNVILVQNVDAKRNAQFCHSL